jgi:Zn finger protein HypA/HybF involved in hydrogenase expression
MTTISFQLPCAHCNADLTGVELSAPCPACGQPIASTIRIDDIDLATHTVCADVSCLSCDYNLRTLPLGAVCPECGRPVVASLQSNVFLGADRQWVHRTYTGVTLLLIASIGGPVAGLLSFFLPTLSGNMLEAIGLIAIGALLGFLILFLAGMWHVSTADPDARKDTSSRWNRWIARSIIVTLGPVAAVVVVSTFLGKWLPLLYGGPAMAVMAPLAVAATFRSLRSIAIRARLQATARCCYAGFWLTIVAGALLVAGGIMFLHMPIKSPAPGALAPQHRVVWTTLTWGPFVAVADCLVGIAALLNIRESLRPARAKATASN